VDSTFLTGAGVVISAVIVFCGSVWMVLTIVLGARLAYFVTASITLAFVVIMGLTWSFGSLPPLGPVGDLPEFKAAGIGEGGQVEFAAASSYPGDPWRVPDEEDDDDTAKASEAESTAPDLLEAAITKGQIDTYDSGDDAIVAPESVRLFTQDEDEYAAVLFQPAPEEGAEAPEPVEPDTSTPDTVLVVMKYDPGNPFGLARLITVGTFLLFLLHLFGLSRAEEKARKLREQTA
jgi:hypothetical protein